MNNSVNHIENHSSRNALIVRAKDIGGINTHSGNPPLAQAGLSLIELMVSLAIGLILLVALSTLLVRQSTTRDELEKSSRQIENGRYGMQLLHDDIQHAGFYGEYSPAPDVTYTTPDPCVTTGDLGWNASSVPNAVPVAIQGYAGAVADPTTCSLNNYKPSTAVLVVRRSDTQTITPASAVANTTYFQTSRCKDSTKAFGLGATGFTLQQKDCTTLSTLRRYLVRIYYISSCDVCTPTSDNIPTLKLLEFADGVQTLLPLVEGIENMQFDYGVDATPMDGAPDTYTTSPATADWANVMAVRVNLLARNNEITRGEYNDAKTYQLSGVSGVAAIPAFNDAYKRHVFSEVVRLINPSSRREAAP